MKKVIYLIGILSSLMSFLGIVFKFFHWPGAAVLIATGFLSFAFFFIPILLFNKFKENDSLINKINYSVGMILGTSLTLGFLFKISQWPMANNIMIYSVILFNFFYIPLYFISRIRTGKLKYETITNSVIMFSFGCILLAMFKIY